jgi:predicted RND superfamily exporter protein
MATLARLALGHPRPVLGAAALLTVVAGLGLPRLRLETDGRALVPQRDPQVAVDREIRDAFGVRDLTVVVLTTGDPRGVFNRATLGSVQAVTRALRRLPGVRAEDLLSLATVPGLRPAPGTPVPAALLDGVVSRPGGVAVAARDFARIGGWRGLLVSRDGRSTALYVGTPPGGDRRAFYRAVRGLAASRIAPGDTFAVLGAPVAEALLGTHILTDLGVPPSWVGEAGERARPAGPASLRGLLRDGVAATVGLVPFAILVMSLVFLAVFRRPAAALVPMVKIGACLTVTFGAMGWLGVPIYLTTAILPVTLIALGITDEIHILRHARELAREEAGGTGPLLARCMDELAMPLVQKSVTTAIGYVAFAVSPIGPARAFGLWGAVGVLVCLLWAVSVTPALLAVLDRRRWTGPAAAAASWPERIFAALGRGAYRRRRLLLAMAAALVIAALLGARRLRVEDRWLDGFDPASDFARAVRHFDRQFAGADLLLLELAAEGVELTGEIQPAALRGRQIVLPAASVAVPARRLAGSRIWLTQFLSERREWQGWIASTREDGGELVLEVPAGGISPRRWIDEGGGPGPVRYEIYREPFTAPGLLHRADQLESFAAGFPVVGGTFGPATQLKMVAFLLDPEREGPRPLPDDPSEIAALWSSLRIAAGPERLRQLVEPEGYTRTLVTLFLREANYSSVARLKAGLEDFARRRLEPYGIALRFAGNAAISQAMIRAIVDTQVGSLALSFLGVFLFAALHSRSLSWGGLVLVPPLLAVLVSFGLMGVSGIPLGVATSMFASMTMGIGDDYTIHLLARHRRLLRTGLAGEGAVVATLQAVGPSIGIDVLAVGIGFSTLLLSQVPVNVRLAGLMVLSVVACFVATLVLVPGLIARRGHSSPGGIRSTPP